MNGTDKVFLKQIDNLERFLRILTSKQEFWSEYLFDFYLIPADYLMILLDEKERFLSLPKSMIYSSSKKRHDSYVRPGSFVTHSRLSISSSSVIVEEDEDEEFRSLDGHKQQ
jgi:hypothetical protein